MIKVKRTYNLSGTAVRTVKDLVEKDGIAASQDALVERAIRGLARRVRDTQHEHRWAELADDPSFQTESENIAVMFGDEDRAGLNSGG